MLQMIQLQWLYVQAAWTSSALDTACTNALSTAGFSNSLSVSNFAAFGDIYC
jgi:hypothetical protein